MTTTRSHTCRFCRPKRAHHSYNEPAPVDKVADVVWTLVVKAAPLWLAVAVAAASIAG